MRRSEDRKRGKVLESACDKVSKVLWKAINELTNKNEPKQKQKLYRSSKPWPANYPQKDELNQFCSSSVESNQKFLEDSYINKTAFL